MSGLSVLIVCIFYFVLGAFAAVLGFLPELQKACSSASSDHQPKEEDMNYTIEVLKGKKQWYWRIVHRNGNILAHSETYSSREKAVKTARKLHSVFKNKACGLLIDGTGLIFVKK